MKNKKKERKKGHDTIRLNDDGTQKSKTYNNCSSVRKFIEASVVHSS